MSLQKLKRCCLFACALLWSCDSDDAGPSGKYTNGIFIINEGGFGASNGSETFINPAGEAEQTVFRNVNDRFAGDVLQSITFTANKGYLVLNGSNTIEIVDEHTFENLSTFEHEDLDKPRYMEVIDNKAYISVWGPYDESFSLIDSYILVVDMNSMTVVKKIDTDEGVERMLLVGNRLFAANYNYGASNTVAVINTADNTLVDQLELSSGPSDLVTDANGKVWVLCAGGNGMLYRINPTTLAIENEIELGFSPSGDLEISSDGTRLIYNDGNLIYEMAIDATSAPAQPWLETDVTTVYGLAVDKSNGDLYITDALNFATEGKVFIYAADGSFKNSFVTGISPTDVVFK